VARIHVPLETAAKCGQPRPVRPAAPAFVDQPDAGLHGLPTAAVHLPAQLDCLWVHLREPHAAGGMSAHSGTGPNVAVCANWHWRAACLYAAGAVGTWIPHRQLVDPNPGKHCGLPGLDSGLERPPADAILRAR